jgi:hypothetical protein
MPTRQSNFSGTVGYFDPNTYGLRGYSFIVPLLFFYDKLVLYGPLSGYIEQCYHSDEFGQTSLSLSDFRKAITEGMIIPAGFETFFDTGIRQEYIKPELGILSSFDEDLLKSNSALGKNVFRIPNNFKFEDSPNYAKKLISKRQKLLRKISMLAANGNLPAKYNDFIKAEAPVPPSLKKELAGLSHSEIVPYLAIYDLCNNRYVMAQQGESRLHIQCPDFIMLYESIHGFDKARLKAIKDNNVNSLLPEISHLISKALRECFEKRDGGRISYEEMKTFRNHYRDGFLTYIWSTISKVQGIPDKDNREEEFIGLLSKKLNNIEFHAGLSPVTLLGAILTHLGYVDVSNPISHMLSGPPGSSLNKIYHKLHSPMNKNDRWAYEFIKEGGMTK